MSDELMLETGPKWHGVGAKPFILNNLVLGGIARQPLAETGQF
jgi:hypothetical protein